MLTLSNLTIKKGSKKKVQRIGRGNASRRGNYSGRGIKGQKSRSGGKSGLKKLGMRNIILQLPKLRGFNRNSKKPSIINISDIEKNFKTGDSVTPRKLLKKELVKSITNGVKVLANGNITKKFTISANSFSKKAVEAIEKSGGLVVILTQKKRPVPEKKSRKE